jgi:hypothetical protein
MFLLPAIFYALLLSATVIVLVLSWNKSIRNEFRENPSAWITVFAILFTTLGPLMGFWRYNKFGADCPFDPKHVFAIEIIVIVSAMCYWFSRFFKKEFPPFINGILRAGLIQGIILDFFVTIHFGTYMIRGLVFPLFGFELLAPPMALLFLLYELHCNIGAGKLRNVSLIAVGKNVALQCGVLFVMVFAEQAILLPVGFEWNSLVLAFTRSHGFIFSTMPDDFFQPFF